jgi:hypothetical protein
MRSSRGEIDLAAIDSVDMQLHRISSFIIFPYDLLEAILVLDGPIKSIKVCHFGLVIECVEFPQFGGLAGLKHHWLVVAIEIMNFGHVAAIIVVTALNSEADGPVDNFPAVGFLRCQADILNLFGS